MRLRKLSNMPLFGHSNFIKSMNRCSFDNLLDWFLIPFGTYIYFNRGTLRHHFNQIFCKIRATLMEQLRLEGFTHFLEGLHRLEGFTHFLEGSTHVLEGLIIRKNYSFLQIPSI